MRNRILWMLLITMAMGCSNDEVLRNVESYNIPVKLTCDIAASSDKITRAFETDNLQYSGGFYGTQTNAIKAFITEAGSSTGVTGSSTNGLVNFTPTGTSLSCSESPLYYPVGKGTDIRAFYPASKITITNPTSGTQTFAVEQNQHDTDGTNYRNSDLMYAELKNIASRTAAYQLTFYHKLSKIKVIATSSSLHIKGVMVVGINRVSGDFYAADGSISAASASTDYVIAYSNTTGTQSVTCSALIPPQTHTATNLIQIETEIGTASYALHASQDFLSGKEYTLTLTVNTNSITFNGMTIKDWGAEQKKTIQT